MTAELIELTKEFHLGNRFTLETAEQLANKLDERFRIIVKYDQPEELPRYNDKRDAQQAIRFLQRGRICHISALFHA